MTFNVKDKKMLENVKSGQKVQFEFRSKRERKNRITSIQVRIYRAGAYKRWRGCELGLVPSAQMHVLRALIIFIAQYDPEIQYSVGERYPGEEDDRGTLARDAPSQMERLKCAGT
jgi:hypothetical protein